MNTDPLIILIAYSMGNYQSEQANVILSMIKQQVYHDIEINIINGV